MLQNKCKNAANMDIRCHSKNVSWTSFFNKEHAGHNRSDIDIWVRPLPQTLLPVSRFKRL